MKTIYKYTIDPHVSGVRMPCGAEILSVAFQGDKLCFWAKVNTDAETELRIFEAFATGEGIPARHGSVYKFMGTGVTDTGLVFHAFERIKEKT